MFCVCLGLLHVCLGLLSICLGLLHVCLGLLSICLDLLSICLGLLSICLGLLCNAVEWSMQTCRDATDRVPTSGSTADSIPPRDAGTPPRTSWHDSRDTTANGRADKGLTKDTCSNGMTAGTQGCTPRHILRQEAHRDINRRRTAGTKWSGAPGGTENLPGAPAIYATQSSGRGNTRQQCCNVSHSS